MPIFFRNTPLQDPFTLDSAGFDWHQEPWDRPDGYPLYHYLQTEQGCGSFTACGRQYRLTEGDGLLIAPFVPHSYHAEGADWITTFVTFTGTLSDTFPSLIQDKVRFFPSSDTGTIRELIRTALRMAPNRIIVGEIRGEEAVDLLQAWNTGHDGSLGTAHANSTGDMISRVETMVLMGMELPLEAVRRQIASGVELLVHLERARDGKRQVAEIAEILGYEDGEVRMHGLYRREKDQLKKIGELQHREKLERCFGETEL